MTSSFTKKMQITTLGKWDENTSSNFHEHLTLKLKTTFFIFSTYIGMNGLVILFVEQRKFDELFDFLLCMLDTDTNLYCAA